MKINWQKKLSSRKFWIALCAFVCAMCALLGVDEITIEKLATTLSSLGVCAVYILTEGYLDSKAMEKNNTNQN